MKPLWLVFPVFQKILKYQKLFPQYFILYLVLSRIHIPFNCNMQKNAFNHKNKIILKNVESYIIKAVWYRYSVSYLFHALAQRELGIPAERGHFYSQ